MSSTAYSWICLKPFLVISVKFINENIYIYIYASWRGYIVLINNSAQLQWMFLILNHAQLETLAQEIVNGYCSERNTAEGSCACSRTGLGQSACYVQWTGPAHSTGTTIHASRGAGLARTSLSRRWNYWSWLWGKAEPHWTRNVVETGLIAKCRSTAPQRTSDSAAGCGTCHRNFIA